MTVDRTHRLELAQSAIGLLIAELRDYELTDLEIASCLFSNAGVLLRREVEDEKMRRPFVLMAAETVITGRPQKYSDFL